MATPNPTLHFPSQCRPKLLKDYLNDNDSLNEQTNLLPKIIVLKRSKYKAASTTILAIHKASELFIKTLKYLPFSSIRSPSILPRSISRRFSTRRRNYDHNDETEMVNVNVNVKVKVKDILRWRSFGDLVNETTTMSTISSHMSNSSWCDSDFMADDFHTPPEKAKNSSFGGGAAVDDILEKSRTMSMDYSKINFQIEEDDEQYTPVSVLDTPFQEDEDSNFHLSLDNLQRRKCALMEMIREYEGLGEVKSTNKQHDESSTDGKEVNKSDEEKAKQILNYFKETNSSECYGDIEDNLLLEKERNRVISYVRNMEISVNRDKFEKEQEEVGLQLEKLILGSLVNELLIDLL